MISTEVYGTWRGEVPDWPRIEKVVKLLTSRMSKRKALDIGYARGGFGDRLAQLGWHVIGIDIKTPKDASIQMVRCDFNRCFPFVGNSFDAVLGGEVLEHALSDNSFVQECARVLRPGGYLILTTPNLVFLANRLRMLIGKLPLFVAEPFHYHFYTAKSLGQLLQSNGLVVDRLLSSHILYSRRRHWTGKIFEILGDRLPTLGAHLIVIAIKRSEYSVTKLK